ncbi:gag-pol polyprotein [Tanacetum coccineum]
MIGYNARQIVGNQNGYNEVQNAGNQNGNSNVVVARVGGNGNGNNGNQIRCYNCIGVGHYARNCTVRPRRMDDAYLQTQDCEEIEEVNANYILMENPQQASTSEEQYFKLLEDTSKPHLVQQDNSNVNHLDSSMAPNGCELEQHTATVEETWAYFESLYNNLVIEVEKVNKAQLGDLKGQSLNTPCASDTLVPLSQKVDDENVSLEF